MRELTLVNPPRFTTEPGNVPFGGFFRVPLKNHRLHYISLIYNNLRQSFLGAKTYFCIPA